LSFGKPEREIGVSKDPRQRVLWETIEIPSRQDLSQDLINVCSRSGGAYNNGRHHGERNLISSPGYSFRALFLHPSFSQTMNNAEFLKRKPRDPC
jgi:hypothetical protein